MFGLLKKKLSESVKKLTKRVEEPEERIKKAKKTGVLKKIKRKVVEKEFSEKDIDEFFLEIEPELLQANVALEVVDFLKENMKKELAGKVIKRGKAKDFIRKSFENSLLLIVEQGSIDIVREIKKKKPYTILFLGFNGSGKTTSIAKLARFLQSKKLKSVLAAGDTFRAASIEQLEHYGNKLNLKTIKHQYGSDSAAVVFDARKYAEANNCDAVLADTAGRTHVDRDLMDELKKVSRVNNPDMKILVIDSLTGNDAVEQARIFNEEIGVDAVVLTKVDVNKKGGSILSVCYAIKKPILFLGTGQDCKDMELFEARKFVRGLLEY